MRVSPWDIIRQKSFSRKSHQSLFENHCLSSTIDIQYIRKGFFLFYAFILFTRKNVWMHRERLQFRAVSPYPYLETLQRSLTKAVTAYVYGVHRALVATVNFLCAKPHHSLSLTATDHQHMSTITMFHYTYPHFCCVLCIPADSTPTNICGHSLIHNQGLSKLTPRGPDQASKHATSGEWQCGPSVRVPSWLFMSCLFKSAA